MERLAGLGRNIVHQPLRYEVIVGVSTFMSAEITGHILKFIGKRTELWTLDMRGDTMTYLASAIAVSAAIWWHRRSRS